jgi:3-oxoacyl-[acyl-carrier-protein] synthase-1
MRRAMKPLLLSHYTATTCAGAGLEATLRMLRSGGTGLRAGGFAHCDLNTYIGVVAGADEVELDAELARFNCRNNRVALIGLLQDDFAAHARAAVARYGSHRVGVFIGTSTAGVLETELAYRQRDPLSGALPASLDYAATHSPFSVADFVRRSVGAQGPSMAISSACSSSAKVFGSASRMLEAGLIDAAVVGGVDSLCQTTLYGFNSLELLSPHACQPFDAQRSGISIGEGAAFALLERPSAHAPGRPGVALLGVGESSDAHHMSSPHPEGLGAQLAMRAALDSARLEPAQIDYINLHGTATPSNDQAEGRAVAALFAATPCSSTKGMTGHTLGAAGAIEAVVAALALQHGFMPGSANTRTLDPAIALDYVLTRRDQALRTVLSNSFGFGGTNCSLVLGQAGDTSLMHGRPS